MPPQRWGNFQIESAILWRFLNQKAQKQKYIQEDNMIFREAFLEGDETIVTPKGIKLTSIWLLNRGKRSNGSGDIIL
jgi:hypothetical protein